MSRITIPNRDQQIDRVIEALGLRPLCLRLIASARCDEAAAHQALELIHMAASMVEGATAFTTQRRTTCGPNSR
jgi:hypothetical protein